MTPALVLLALYGAALLVLGWLASRRAASSPEDYFLAGSGLGTVVLFMALSQGPGGPLLSLVDTS